VGAFNFSGGNVTKKVDFWRLGLDSGRDYTVTDLWTNQAWSARDRLEVGLAKDFARLVRID
jgi:hypothetical protein